MDSESGLSSSAADYYLTKRGAQHYDHKYRRLSKRIAHRRECRILEHLLTKAGPVDTVLDIPCGTGRFGSVVSKFTRNLHLADLSPHMLQIAAEANKNTTVACSVCNVFDLRSNGVRADGILSVRLLHHLHDETQQRQYLEALAGAASKWLIFTFLDAHAPKTIFRTMTRKWRGKGTLATHSIRQLTTIMRTLGFTLVASKPVSPFFSGHRFALFARAAAA